MLCGPLFHVGLERPTYKTRSHEVLIIAPAENHTVTQSRYHPKRTWHPTRLSYRHLEITRMNVQSGPNPYSSPRSSGDPATLGSLLTTQTTKQEFRYCLDDNGNPQHPTDVLLWSVQLFAGHRCHCDGIDRLIPDQIGHRGWKENGSRRPHFRIQFRFPDNRNRDLGRG